MFRSHPDHSDNITATSIDNTPGPYASGKAAKNLPVAKPNELDRTEMTTLHANLLGHYAREIDRQHENRKAMAEDEAFYDHEQWTEEEKAVLDERGQMPLVFNVIFTSVNWVLGTQREKPFDYRVLPRRPEGAAHAERKSELLKYLDEVDHMQIGWSRAFAEQVKAGLSWVETGGQNPEDGEVVFQRYESYRNIVHDSAAQEWDMSDGRYMFRAKWLDLDRAQAMFPHRAEMLARSVEEVISMVGAYGGSVYGDPVMDSQEIEQSTHAGVMSDGFFSRRRRVRLIECWHKKPVPAQFVRGGDFNGQMYDPMSEGHQSEVMTGRANVIDRVKEVMHVALMCDKGMLHYSPTPYRHNRYPFTPLWGYRRASDGLPYGMIRGIKDIQRDLNKRASKMLHHLTSQRLYIQEGSVKNEQQTVEEAHRPDAVIIYKAGQPAPRLETDFNIAQAHAELMSRDAEMIEKTSGVTDESMGRETNATSGKAIIARQEQGRLSVATFFQNYQHARRLHGEKVLANIEQYFSEPHMFRITDARGRPKYVSMNDPKSEQDDAITMTKADFVLTDADSHATQRQADMTRLMEALQIIGSSNPELITSLLDLLVEAMDIPQRDEIVKRIRQVTGQIDPDYDPQNPDPEIEAQLESQKASSAMQERMMEAEIATVEAKAAVEQAKAEKALAEIEKIMADVRQIDPESAALEKLSKAIGMAVQLRGAAGAGAVADMLMTEAERMALEDEAAMLPPPGPAPMGAMDPAMMDPAMDPMAQQMPMEADPSMGGAIDPMTGQPIPQPQPA